MTGRWPEIRAGLIALACAIGLLDGCPLPDAPDQHREMEKRLSPGWVRVVDDIKAVRDAALTPVGPIRDLGRLRQRWQLFTGTPRERYRMRIEARGAGAAPWELVYRAQDDAHDFLADRLAYRRIRAAWNPRGSGGPRATYDEFASWIAREVFAREPRFVEVRVSMERVEIGERGGVRDTGVLVHAQKRRRKP